MLPLRTLTLIAAAALAPRPTVQMIGINVVFNTDLDAALLEDLDAHGQVLDLIPELRAVTMRVQESALAEIQALPYVAAARPDTQGSRASCPVSFGGFGSGANAWNLDAIDVTDFGVGRTAAYDGTGVYVAIIDDGLPQNWREYLQEERVAVAFARSFGGGGGDAGTVSSQPNLWEHNSKDGHGIACAAIVLGFRYQGPEALAPVFNGVAPGATVIPINIFHNAEFYWSSVKAHSILYVAQLKQSGALGGARVVINLSNGGPEDDPLEKAAIDYALAQGVVIVAAAGNEASQGMRFPARYSPVISAAAVGDVAEFPANDPSGIVWIQNDVPENDPLAFFMAPFTAVALPGQDLDIAAPGYMVPAPWAEQNGQLDYSYFTGTSAAAPHVAGLAALMLQKNPLLSAAQIESILESSALPIPSGCRNFTTGFVLPGNPPTWGDHDNVHNVGVSSCWGADTTGHGLARAAAALAATPFP